MPPVNLNEYSWSNAMLDRVMDGVRAFTKADHFEDDVCLLGVRCFSAEECGA